MLRAEATAIPKVMERQVPHHGLGKPGSGHSLLRERARDAASLRREDSGVIAHGCCVEP